MNSVKTFIPRGDNVALLQVEHELEGGITLPEGFDPNDAIFIVKAVSLQVKREHGLNEGDKVIAVTRPKNTVINVGNEEWRITTWQDIKGVYTDE